MSLLRKLFERRLERGVTRRHAESVFLDEHGGGGHALNGRHDGGVEEADGIFALGEKLLQAIAGRLEIASGEAVAEFEDDAATGFRHEEGDVFLADLTALIAEVGVDFVQLVEDLPGVRADIRGEAFEGIGSEFQLPLSRGGGRGLAGGLVFVETRTAGRFVEDVGGREFGQGFVEGAAFVRADRAEQEAGAFGESAFEDFLQFFERFKNGFAPAELRVGEEVGAFQPDEFFRGEKSGHAEREDGFADDRGGVLGVVRVGVDRLDGEFTALRRGEFRGEFFGAGLDRHFIVADDEVGGGVLGGFFGFGRHTNGAATPGGSSSAFFATVGHRTSGGGDFFQPGAGFEFGDLVAEEGGAFEFQGG